MKKNIIFGMLVSLLAIPTFAQEQVAEAPVEAPQATGTHFTAGSTISVGVGLAGSGLATKGDKVYSGQMGMGLNASLRYTYYVYKFMGITTGLDFSSYQAAIGLKGMYTWDATTDMGIDYKRMAYFGDKYSNWIEVENINMFEIPVALTFKYKPNKVGLIGTAGVKVAFPFSAQYQSKGTVNICNYFPGQNTSEVDGVHVTRNAAYEVDVRSYDKNMWSAVNGQVFAEFGALFEVHPRLDLSFSVYGNYGFNNIVGSTSEFGFANSINKLDQPLAPMAAYKGLLGTAVDHVNPWCVGAKIALHINCRKKSDERIAAEAYVAPEVVYVYDTVHQVINRVFHDTVFENVYLVDSVTSWIMDDNQIIYYNVGDATHPIIEPENLIELLASTLIGDRTTKVMVEGHASADGNPSSNQRLAYRRAETIVKLLKERGVNPDQLEIRTVTRDAKQVNLSDKAALVKDRRVTIIPMVKPVKK